MARGSQEEVEKRRKGWSVKAVDGTDATKHAVGHCLRDAHHKYRDASDNVFEEVALGLIGAHNSNKGQKPEQCISD